MKRMRQCTVNNQYQEGKRKAGKEKKDSAPTSVDIAREIEKAVAASESEDATEAYIIVLACARFQQSVMVSACCSDSPGRQK